MPEFRFEIPNEKTGSYRIVSLMIILVNTLVFGRFCFSSDPHFYIPAALAALLNLGYGIYFYRAFRQKQHAVLRVDYLFLLNAIAWAVMGQYLAATGMLLIAMLGFFSSKKLLLVFSAEGIRYPSFPAKHITWTQVEQAMLKDDILTIDLRNNQLLQLNICQSPTPQEVAVFNAFCKTAVEDGVGGQTTSATMGD
ncbi:MAG: hypothetical protein JWQ27_2284 [Ferruginibacter sp.]|nr:hypothetical protein [Ferruginibacter sp.]